MQLQESGEMYLEAILVLSQRGKVVRSVDVSEYRGRAIAENIYEKHQLLSKFLMEIGVDEETAVDDACKMEHVISDKSFAAIKKHWGF